MQMSFSFRFSTNISVSAVSAHREHLFISVTAADFDLMITSS